MTSSFKSMTRASSAHLFVMPTGKACRDHPGVAPGKVPGLRGARGVTRARARSRRHDDQPYETTLAAPNAALLIVARLVQGVGGALVVPSSLALLNGTLRAEDRARGIGIWAGISTLATTLGPYGGGWLVDHASWRWVFLLNLPLILLALLVLSRLPAGTSARRPLSLDAAGALLAVLGLGGVIYALTEGPGTGWTGVVARVGGVVMVALVPVLLGAGGATGLAAPLARHYQSAMLVFAAVTALAAALTAVFVPSRRATPAHLAPAPRVTSCAPAAP
jgi:MFS family permease